MEKERQRLIQENEEIFETLSEKRTVEEARDALMQYVLTYEVKILNTLAYSNPMERSIAKKCVGTLKNVISKRSEQLTEYSAVEAIWKLSKGEQAEVTRAFTTDLLHLFLGMKGETGLYSRPHNTGHDRQMDSRTISKERSNILDDIAAQVLTKISTYQTGMDQAVIEKRHRNKERIKAHYNATEEEWNDWKWQCRKVIRDAQAAEAIISLTAEEKAAITLAKEQNIPFGITPYYAMLMDEETHRIHDHAVRAQVIPPMQYVEYMTRVSGKDISELDFMGEHDTSPEDLVTRRYPLISIFKPNNTCSQICVYCQRNWEIDDVLAEGAQAPKVKLERALEWYRNHPNIREILVTGGDPAIMSDQVFKGILDQISQLEQIQRIRIGTRIPAVMPMRVTDSFADLLASYHIPGKREVCVVTHFEHVYEVTPEAMEAVQKLRQRKIPVYNQGVFTMENARKFEMVALRRLLRLIGVDPYYTFNTKGKEETWHYRVPIARLMQEQAEEARLTPGLERTDEAVFNIPRLGKNYLRAGQDHEVIMILPTGERVYEFYPWDSSEQQDNHPYIQVDIAIQEFLDRIEAKGENIEDYRSIWYYL